MAKGTIARLMDRGFGFIKTEEGGDLFFHRTELEGVEFINLSEGQEVEFEKGQGRDGRPAAVKVRLAEIHVGDDSSEGGDEDAASGEGGDEDAASGDGGDEDD
jgi:CspA family cold shock protein